MILWYYCTICCSILQGEQCAVNFPRMESIDTTEREGEINFGKKFNL